MVPALYADDEKESIVGSVCRYASTQMGKKYMNFKLLILINITQPLQALLVFLHSISAVFWEQRFADFARKSITKNSLNLAFLKQWDIAVSFHYFD